MRFQHQLIATSHNLLDSFSITFCLCGREISLVTCSSLPPLRYSWDCRPLLVSVLVRMQIRWKVEISSCSLVSRVNLKYFSLLSFACQDSELGKSETRSAKCNISHAVWCKSRAHQSPRFWISRILEFSNSQIFEFLNSWIFESPIFGKSRIRKFENLEIRKFENSKFANSKIRNLELWVLMWKIC